MSYLSHIVISRCFGCRYLLVAYFLYIRLSKGITRSATCLVGRTALITGANAGLGFQTALNLASRGCKIIMADVADMEESKRRIKTQTNNPNVFTKHLDLSSFESIRNFAAEILKSEETLHILINNAGIYQSDKNLTVDDLNPVTQINYFGPFLLTHLLTNLLKKSAPSRIIFSSSSSSFVHSLTPENLTFVNKSRSFWGNKTSYCNSKFAVLIASDTFADKLKEAGVTSNSIHPGIVSTSILSQVNSGFNSIILNFLFCLYVLFFSKDAWEGSQVLVHAAVSKKLERVSGEHFWDCKPFWKPKAAHDKEFCEKIWKATEKIVQLRPDEKI